MLGAADIPHVPSLGACFQPDTEDSFGYTVLNSRQHLVEHPEAFVFILDFRILFGKGPQEDALFEMVHRIQMVLPGAVVNLKQHIPFEVGKLTAEKLPSGLFDFIFYFVSAIGFDYVQSCFESFICPLDGLFASE